MPSKAQLPFVLDRNGNGVPVLPFLGPTLPFVPGNIWHVRPRTGSDVNSNGRRPDSAFKTLRQALSAAVANQNDVVLLYAEGNTASATTDYQNALLDWNKDGVHLIGVNAGPSLSQRSRVAFQAAYAAATDLFKLSANGCLIANIEFFMGVASALPTGCMTVSGDRNHVKNCHIAGFGNSANDISGAYSLQLGPGAAENLFEDCTIGVQTIKLGSGTSNSQILINDANSFRNIFKGGRCLLYTSSATVAVFLRAPALNGFTEFKDFAFINEQYLSGGTQLTNGFVMPAGGSAIILSGQSCVYGAAGVIAAASGIVLACGQSVTGTSNALGVAVAHA